MLWLFHLACRAQCNPLSYETTKNAVVIPNYSCKSSYALKPFSYHFPPEN